MGPIQKAQIDFLVQENFFERILSTLFPPKLPRLSESRPEVIVVLEQGECGKAQRRPYRDALDRIRKTGKI